MITVVRQGSTSFNDGKEKLRGRLPLPLSRKGNEEAMSAAEKLKSLKLDFKDLHTSPLKRSVQTADHVSNEVGMEPIKTDKLTDWNTGNFTGKTVQETLSDIHNFMNNPSKSIPGGESFNDFKKRAIPFLKSLVESDDNHLVVTHNRVVTLLKALSNSDGTNPDMSTMKKKGPLEPGGIMTIDPEWNAQIVHKGTGMEKKDG